MEGSGQVPREASWEPVRCRRWASTCTPGAPGREVPGAGGLRPVTPRGSGDFPGWKQAFVLVLPNPAPHPPPRPPHRSGFIKATFVPLAERRTLPGCRAELQLSSLPLKRPPFL